MSSSVTLVNHFTGKIAILLLWESIDPDPNKKVLSVIGLITDVLAQGVTVNWGQCKELISFIPWDNIRVMTYTMPISPDDSHSKLVGEAAIVVGDVSSVVSSEALIIEATPV